MGLASKSSRRDGPAPKQGRRLLAGAGVAAIMLPAAAHADLVFINNGYHYQQSPFYCGEGAMEMMLDSPAVTGANAVVANNLAIAAANNILQNWYVNPTYGVVSNLAGDNALQNSLYSAVWGSLTPRAYFSGMGTPPPAFARVMNAADTTHRYANYNFYGTLLNGDYASRTLAGALKNYNVPASVVVESGAHWIDVNGVSTNGTVGANGSGNYTINGFFVRDPWTGLAVGNPRMAALGGLGLGFNTYLRYGLDNINGNLRLAPWFQYFNPTSPRSSPANAYSIIVEPPGPEAIVSSDPNVNLSDPTGIPITNALLSPLSGSQADTDAVSDLSADSDLDALPGLTGGSFDTSDTMDITLQGDQGDGDSDWLIPYDGGGGVNDVTGALMIDADTGLIDEATWFDGTDGINDVSLATIDAWGMDQQTGLLPQDDLNLPEPASAVLLLTGAAVLGAARRRRVA